MFWVAEGSEGELVGFLRVHGNAARRLSHSALIVIGIVREFWHQGVGTRLFEVMEDWAQKQEIHRLELTVMVPNLRAVGLYHNRGFVVEGLRRNSIRYADGTFVDEYMMAKLL
jgi:RimJ/RimL family protein N-acetyltransferase